MDRNKSEKVKAVKIAGQDFDILITDKLSSGYDNLYEVNITNNFIKVSKGGKDSCRDENIASAILEAMLKKCGASYIVGRDHAQFIATMRYVFWEFLKDNTDFYSHG